MTKVPKPCKHSPAADLIKDELEHRGFTASAAARAMKIPASRLSQIFTGRKPVSADTAMRFQALTGVSAETIMRIQNAHDFQKAYHASSKSIFQEVKEVATPVS